MKGVFNVLVGVLVFYFIGYTFSNVITFAAPGGFQGVFLAGLVFGILVALIPTLLGFLKIKETTGALILGGVVLNFAFYFVGYYLLNMFTIKSSGVVAVFHNSLTIAMNDKVLVLIVMSLFSSIMVVLVQTLSKKK